MDVITRYLLLIRHAVWPGPEGIARPTLRHFFASLALLATLPLLLTYHAVGFLLDEILFRGYRRVAIDQPLFVLGPPRSGTTSVHEALAEDERFTTFRTWECFFGLSVTWRFFWRGVGRVDRWFGRPLSQLAKMLTRRLATGLEATHPLRLDAPEEDYFAFLPFLWCFLLLVPFPDAPWLWRWGRFDAALSPREKQRLMASYRRAIQRHLYAHPGKRYLAKNAAFAPLAHTLLETFPDARVVCCLREPEAALSSQLSCLHPSLRALHGNYRRQRFARRMTALYGFYYRNLLDALAPTGATDRPRAVFLPLAALADLERTVTDTYRGLGLTLTPEFRQRIAFRARGMRGWRSAHQHNPAGLPVPPELLQQAFGGLRGRFDFDADRVVAPREPRVHLAGVAAL